MAKKEKPVKEKPEKKKGLFGQNKVSDDGLDIMTDIKEPFSFRGFFDTHVADKFRRAKRALQDHGVLFFLFSPFQARGRLIAQMIIIVAGIMFGVIPRASSMVNTLQQDAYRSEIANLKTATVGSISIDPAASSNYKRMHLLAFVISGKNLPSDPEKYDVKLARGYGASDWQDVTYSWDMFPVDDDRRIMLVAIDQTKQPSGYGAFQLFIQLKDDEKVSKYAMDAGLYEITLSSAQPTTALYDKDGIHLSVLSDKICGAGEIEKKQAEFQDALNKYQVALEQVENLPIDVQVTPTVDDLETYCLANRVYRHLKDDSNTEDILAIERVFELPRLDYGVSLISGGIEYDAAFVSELSNEAVEKSEEEARILREYETVKSAKDDVLRAMDAVNTAADSWFKALESAKLVLNQTIKIKQFPLYARATELIGNEIAFLDETPESPDEKTPGGIVSEYEGDSSQPATEPEPPVLEPEPEPPVLEPEPEPPVLEPEPEPPVLEPEPEPPVLEPEPEPPVLEPEPEPPTLEREPEPEPPKPESDSSSVPAAESRPTYQPPENPGNPADNK